MIVIAVFAIVFFNKQKHGNDNFMDEVGHELDEIGDNIKDKKN